MHKQAAALEILSRKIASGEIGKAKDWQGADVVISQNPLEVDPNSFYPSPRNVVTSFSSELSWLFENLRDTFINLEGYGFWKEELFGRFGNASNRFLARNVNSISQKLLLAVIHEAHCILEEMENGEFQALPITVNNMIFDDVFREIEIEGSADAAEVDAFIKSLGITS